MDNKAINSINQGKQWYLPGTPGEFGKESQSVPTDSFQRGEPVFYSAPVYDTKKAAEILLKQDTRSVSPKELWSFDTGGRKVTSPVAGPDGTLYAGSDKGTLHALDPVTGAEKWKASCTADHNMIIAITASGTVLVSGDKGAIQAFDGTTGKEKWSYEHPAKVPVRAGAGKDGTVVLSCKNKLVLCLHEQDGKEKWRYSASGSLDTPPATGPDGTVYVGGETYVGAVKGFIVALDGDTGKFKWGAHTRDAGMKAPIEVASDGTVLAGGDNFYLHAFDGKTGKQKWSGSMGYWVRTQPSVADDGKTVFASGFSNTLAAFDLENGTKKWDLSFKTAGMTSPVAGDENMLFVSDSDNKMLILHQKTGEVLGEHDFKVTSGGRPLYDRKGILFVPGESGKLSAFMVKSSSKQLEEAVAGLDSSAESAGKLCINTDDIGNLDVGGVTLTKRKLRR